MKKNISKTAFTLIELIVSLALVSIIVLGVFSISMVLSNNSQDYAQRYLVKSQTQTTLNYILTDAALAVGNAVTGPGIVIVPTGNANSAFCIHQQNNGQSVTGSVPITDNWKCYTWDNTSTDGASYKTIYYCYRPWNTTLANNGAGSLCNIVGFPENFLGTAFDMIPEISINPNTEYGYPMNGNAFFSVAIENCLNDQNAATCFNASDPVNNPQITVSGSVTPTQEGMPQN